ncbi:hypothetical protein WICMUC_003835 [Wickerhamomyces mucosus]|uniref:Uncharacterized protein n=1 Tax=Wickerhamomyces mucosus TaxID=1378264 RepID=A0A9P8PJH7_9ASCO|nr:hypothetical protein WICMUC_003835 [Wickerhamomyces mucosus]
MSTIELHKTTNDQSISTDSEESFLMRQLNKSSLFNSSDGSQYNPNATNTNSSNSSNSRILQYTRRSYFRESFIDENGEDRTFNIFHDAINEVSVGDSSKDVSLTGIEHLNQNILNELDFNQSKSSISRNNSNVRRNISKRRSGQSLNILENNHVMLVDSIDDSIVKRETNASEFSSLDESNPTPIPDKKSQSDTSEQKFVQKVPISPLPNVPEIFDKSAVFKSPNGINSQNLSKKSSDSSLYSNSNKSLQSQTRESILNFEESRKKQPGFKFQHNKMPRVNSNSHIRPILEVIPSAADIGVTPSILSPLSTQFQNSIQKDTITDDAGVPKPSKSIIKGTKLKALKKSSALGFYTDTELVSIKEYDSIPKEYQDSPLPNDDDFFTKLYESRSEKYISPPIKFNRVAWIVYLISFIIPPLFFFLGFGLLDQQIGYFDRSIKRISLATGVLVTFLLFAMIAVGFGVGLHNFI